MSERYPTAAEPDLEDEAPEADTAEQMTDIVEDDEDAPTEVPSDVNEADALEQHRSAAQDDDDYR